MSGALPLWAGPAAMRVADLPNLVRNPSFDQIADGRAVGWELQYRPVVTDPGRAAEFKKKITFSPAPAGYTDGSSAGLEATGVGQRTGYAFIEQIVPVRPNARYYFSIMAKSSGGWSSVVVAPLTAERKGVPRVPGGNFEKSVPPEATIEYVKMQQQIQTGADTAFLSIQFRANAGTVRVNFDDAKLLEIPTSAN